MGQKMQTEQVFNELKALWEDIEASYQPKKDQSAINDKIQSAENRLAYLQDQLPDCSEELNRFYKRCNREEITPETHNQLAEKLGQKVANVRFDWYNRPMFAALLPLCKIMYDQEDNGDPYVHAYKLSVIFNSARTLLKYWNGLQKQHKLGNEPLHNACLFTLPHDSFDLRTWRIFADKYHDNKEFWELLPNAYDIEQEICHKAEQRQTQPSPKALKGAREAIQKTRNAYKKLKRHRDKLTEEQKHEQKRLLQQIFQHQKYLTELAPGFGQQLTVEDLRAFKAVWMNNAAPVYKYFLQNNLTKKDYDRFLELERHDDADRIPSAIIDGAQLGDQYAGYYLRKLGIEDENEAALACVLGKLTGNCQSLSGEVGEYCVRHGLTSSYGGFYVLFKGNINDSVSHSQIVAQSWAWRSQSGALVFDSIECSKTNRSEPGMLNMIAEFYQQLAKELIDQGHTHKVACGQQSGVKSELFIETRFNTLERFHSNDYTPRYYDSEKQAVVYEHNKPYYWYSLQNSELTKTHTLLDQIFTNHHIPFASNIQFQNMLLYAIENDEPDLLAAIHDKAHQYGQDQKLFNIIENTEKYQRNQMAVNEIIETVNNDELLINAINQSTMCKPIYDLIGQGDNETVQKHLETFIDKGAHLQREKSEQSNFALLVRAAINRNLYAVDKLIDAGAPINDTNQFGYSVLTVVATLGDLRLVNKVIESGSRINNDGGCCYALYWAIEFGYREIVDRLVEAGANISGTQALKTAADGGSLEILNNLARAQANRDLDSIGESPSTSHKKQVQRKHSTVQRQLDYIEKAMQESAPQSPVTRYVQLLHSLTYVIKKAINEDHLQTADQLIDYQSRALNEGLRQISESAKQQASPEEAVNCQSASLKEQIAEIYHQLPEQSNITTYSLPFFGHEERTIKGEIAHWLDEHSAPAHDSAERPVSNQ